MKLSVSAFRAQGPAQRKILSSYRSRLDYGACTSFPAPRGARLDKRPEAMVESTGIHPAGPGKPTERGQSRGSLETRGEESQNPKMEKEKEETKEERDDPGSHRGKAGEAPAADRTPGRTRSKSNQRWMKLRTTVQLSGAVSGTGQKSKPGLKREDSFLKRFSTRQIPETQETVDAGDETEAPNGSPARNEANGCRRKRRREASKTVVNPDENFFFYWLMTVAVCVLYNLWTLIVRQSFPELQKAASAFWYSGDGFADLVFVCDVAVQFRTGYLEQGLMVYDARKLAAHYLKSRAFVLDVLSLVPLDFVQLNAGVNPILRFPRFLKIYRVYDYYYMVESRTVYPNLWRVANLVHILLILAHWFGCFYYLLSEAEDFQGDWVYPYRPGDYATLTRKYLGSLYWSTLTLTTIGDLPTPETNAEYLFTIISYLIGVFIFATIVGQVGNVITNRNANRLEFERLLDGAKTYMRHHKVPGGMKRRVLRWYDYSWSRGRIQGGGDINTALGLLPDKLKTELALHVNLSVLKKVTIFQECQPEFLHDLVLKMKAYIFTPGDLICRKGEVAREMFIIADGILDVISESGRVLTTMKAGDFFGEIGILNLDGLNKRTADVRSVGYSELFSLSREDVLAAMKDYPEAQEILQSLGRKRLMEAKNASKIFRTQAKDRDSSGDSDAAGKRMVDKLRSDVKGLKNVLRRSRRGARTKEIPEGSLENSAAARTTWKKHSILRRMSHVQSSDECEPNNEIVQTPIGAGLPLLQRLRLLKEKQGSDREDKEKSKPCFLGVRGENSGAETLARAARRPALPKQHDEKAAAVSRSAGISSTVRTQLTGVRFDTSNTSSKAKATAQAMHAEKKSARATVVSGDGNDGSPKREKTSPTKPLKSDGGGIPGKVENSTATRCHEPAGVRPSNFADNFDFEPADDVPLPNEAGNSESATPENGLDAAASRDGWKLLRKSSIECSKSAGKMAEIDESTGEVSKRVAYLSKSDTVLEKQESTNGEEKRFRPVDPSDGFRPHTKSPRKTVEKLTSDGRRTASLEPDPLKTGVGNEAKVGTGANSSAADEVRRNRKQIKKYNSIRDLSPEYSGLSFVKKLKILNERQKLAELEKELLTRSASLDVATERPAPRRGSELVRSRSEASTTEFRRTETCEPTAGSIWAASAAQREATPTEACPVLRHLMIPDLRQGLVKDSERSILSPESNETLERRHLKSILKKLSAEENSNDGSETPDSRGSNRPRKDAAELKKLMRAPTVEGYAARHKKLAKSVTFDSDAVPAGIPDAAASGRPSGENGEKGVSPMSPTALLALRLSDWSTTPLARPNPAENGEGKQISLGDRVSEADEPEATLRKTTLKPEGATKDKENLMAPLLFREVIGESFPTRHFEGDGVGVSRESDADTRNEFETALAEIQNEWWIRFTVLAEEIKRRDAMIFELRSHIRNMQREGRIGRNLAADSPTTDLPSVSSYFKRSLAVVKNSPELEGATFPFEYSATERSASDWPFWYSAGVVNVTDCETEKSGTESDDDRVTIARQVPFSPDDGVDERREPSKSRPRSSSDSFSDEESEFPQAPGPTLCDCRKKKKTRGTEFKSSNSSKGDTAGEARTGIKWPGERKKSKVGGKTIIGHFTDASRTFAAAEKNCDFVALEIEDGSDSGDAENWHDKDWEVQMLVRELTENDPDWGTEGDRTSRTSGREKPRGHGHEVKQLQEDVTALKRMMRESDLAELTSSELDVLEAIVEAKDRKISRMAKSEGQPEREDEWQDERQAGLLPACSSPPDDDLEKKERKKKRSLAEKIGQALSFDIHDNQKRKRNRPGPPERRPLISKRRKAVVSRRERRGNSFNPRPPPGTNLGNGVLDDRGRIGDNVTEPFSESPGVTCPGFTVLIAGSSAPAPTESESLPVLLPTEHSGSPASSSEGAAALRRSQDSASEEEEPKEPPRHLEIPSDDRPSASGVVASCNSHNNVGLNAFIKHVGQKMKKVVSRGDVDTARKQFPTVSSLCEGQAMLKDEGSEGADQRDPETKTSCEDASSADGDERDSLAIPGSVGCDNGGPPDP